MSKSVLQKLVQLDGVPDHVVGACPLDCPDGCSWIVDFENGHAKKLRGNPDHPFTGKALCAKTTRYLEYMAHPDRLLYPQKRIGKKGEGRFERISWDQAFEEIATNIKNTISQFGAEAIWPYSGTGTVGWIQGIVGAGKRLFHYLGASQHDPNICSKAGHVGISYTTGSAAGMDPEDLVYSKLIILWGTNTVETNQHLWPFIQKARKKNDAVLVTVDPIRTATAQRSDLHIQLTPGTDAALVLGLIRELADDNQVDLDFINQKTIGWQKFYDEILVRHDLETASRVCEVDLDQLKKLKSLIADRRPMGIKTAMGIQQHAGGGQAARVLTCLPAVMGSFKERGGGFCYSTGPTYQLNMDALCRPDLMKKPTRYLPMSQLGSVLAESNDEPVKSLIVMAANPVVSNPDQSGIRKGLAREDLFTVVIDVFQTDTADYADLLLPATMQTEHSDLHDSFSHMYLQWNQAATKPLGECMTHTEIFRRIANAMGVEEPSVHASDDELAASVIDPTQPATKGISIDQLKKRGWARLSWPQPFLPFKDSFPTTSGKFEFESEQGEKDGVGRFPHFVPPRNLLQKGNGLRLITSANKRMINSVYGAQDRQRDSDQVTITLNPKDASQRNLSDGQRVNVFNPTGQFRARLIVSDRAKPGVAQCPKGLWPKFNGGHSVNAAVEGVEADMGHGAVFKDNTVWVTSVQESV